MRLNMVVELTEDDIFVVSCDGRTFVIGSKDEVVDFATENTDAVAGGKFEVRHGPIASLDAEPVDTFELSLIALSRAESREQESETDGGSAPLVVPETERTFGDVIGDLIDYCEKNKSPDSIEKRAALIEEALDLNDEASYGSIAKRLGVSKSTIATNWSEPSRWDIDVDDHYTRSVITIGESLGRGEDGEAALDIIKKYNVTTADVYEAATESESFGGFKDRLVGLGYDLGGDQFGR